jgi:hypothetical protein
MGVYKSQRSRRQQCCSWRRSCARYTGLIRSPINLDPVSKRWLAVAHSTLTERSRTSCYEAGRDEQNDDEGVGNRNETTRPRKSLGECGVLTFYRTPVSPDFTNSDGRVLATGTQMKNVIQQATSVANRQKGQTRHTPGTIQPESRWKSGTDRSNAHNRFAPSTTSAAVTHEPREPRRVPREVHGKLRCLVD